MKVSNPTSEARKEGYWIGTITISHMWQKKFLLKQWPQQYLLWGVFKLSLGLCDEPTKLIQIYWWRVEGGKRKRITSSQG